MSLLPSEPWIFITRSLVDLAVLYGSLENWVFIVHTGGTIYGLNDQINLSSSSYRDHIPYSNFHIDRILFIPFVCPTVTHAGLAEIHGMTRCPTDAQCRNFVSNECWSRSMRMQIHRTDAKLPERPCVAHTCAHTQYILVSTIRAVT
jgi:hypothetical protein